MVKLGDFLIDIKPQPLRDTDEWTSHVAIYKDGGNAIESIYSEHMGNRCNSQEDAYEAGLSKAKSRLLE